MKLLIRLFFILIGIPLLIIPTLYATARDLNELPWGLNSIFGNDEDGWSGNGTQRRLWYNQGWWPHYLGVQWSELSFINRWWFGYKWCSLRNPAWNLRTSTWYADSIHYADINITKMVLGDEVTIEWLNKDGKKRYFKRRNLWGDTYLEYGYEFKPELFTESHPVYKIIRTEGYTGLWKYRHVSIPSVRPRKIK